MHFSVLKLMVCTIYHAIKSTSVLAIKLRIKL